MLNASRIKPKMPIGRAEQGKLLRRLLEGNAKVHSTEINALTSYANGSIHDDR